MLKVVPRVCFGSLKTNPFLRESIEIVSIVPNFLSVQSHPKPKLHRSAPYCIIDAAVVQFFFSFCDFSRFFVIHNTNATLGRR